MITAASKIIISWCEKWIYGTIEWSDEKIEEIRNKSISRKLGNLIEENIEVNIEENIEETIEENIEETIEENIEETIE